MNDLHFAIAIGIDTYPQLRRLTASVRDATAFCEWLASKDGGNLPEKNIKYIPSLSKMPADRFDARPIRIEIDRALRDFGIEEERRIGERLYFYFAGHGFGPQFDDVGMLMANAAMTSLTENIGLRPFRDYFHETKRFDQVVFLLDCCRDRDLKDDTFPPGFKKTAAPNGNHVVDFVVMASAYGDKAFAPVNAATNERRGILTRALLEGLGGAPRAVDPDGRVTATSLRAYLMERVPTLAKEEDLAQQAEANLPTTEIIFRKLDPAGLKRLRVRIVIPAKLNGEFVLREGSRREEIGRRNADQARAENPWTEDLLVNSRYELEHVDGDLAVIIDPAKAKKDPYVFEFP